MSSLVEVIGYVVFGVWVVVSATTLVGWSMLAITGERAARRSSRKREHADMPSAGEMPAVIGS